MRRITLLALALMLYGNYLVSASAQEISSWDSAEHSGYETATSLDSMEPDDLETDVAQLLSVSGNSAAEDVGTSEPAILGETEEVSAKAYGRKGTWVSENAKYSLNYTITYDGKVIIGECIGNGSDENWGNLVIPNEIEGLPVVEIAYGVFENCSAFNGTLTLPEGLEQIGMNAFSGCSGLSGSLTLPDSITNISHYAFRDCNGFKGTLTLPSSLAELGNGAFEGCSGFTGNLTLPGSLTVIPSYAFRYCSGFKGILTLPGDLEQIQLNAFEGCSGFSGNLTLPDSLTSIEFYAFKDCSGFTGNLMLPGGLTTMGVGSFYGCSGFSGNLTLPNSLTTIAANAFKDCTGFNGILTLPNGLTSIGNWAFDGCSGFTGKLTLPNGLTSIENCAFRGCNGFSGDLRLPSGVTNIGTSAFDGCSGFDGILELPDSLTSIGATAFRNCSSFKGTLTIPNGVTSIGNGTFDGCSGFDGKLILSSSLTNIGREAFKGCSGFTGSLILPDSLTGIENYAFQGCSGFDGNLTLSSGLTNIGREAFKGCSGFTGSLILPDSLTGIENYAFQGCSGFDGNLTLSSGLTNIGREAFQGCSGFTGSLALPNGITTISDSAFKDCCGLDGSLILPNGLTDIGGEAFSGCDNILNISIPDSVTAIGNRAFLYCNGIINVYYGGDKARWNSIGIESGNDYLKKADIHYNTYYTVDNMPSAIIENDNPVAVITPSGSSTPIFSYRYETQAYGVWKPQGYNSSYSIYNSQGYYSNWSDTVTSYLYDNGNGLTRVEYHNGKVVIENYDRNFHYQTGWTLEPELPVWGGFYAGEKYNFLIFGQLNPNEDDSMEVIRVVKYDKSWNRLNHASLRGANTTEPFGAGSLRCDEHNGMLYVHTCHRMYTNPQDGLRHQANLTFSVREANMRITDQVSGVEANKGYVSHSFNQFLLVDGEGNIVTLNHGDAYPRSAVMIRYGEKAGKNGYTGRGASEVNLFAFPGAIGDNNTNASIGGLAETSSGYIAVYNYSPNDNNAGIRNIHISYVPKDSFTQESVRTWTDSSALGTTPVIASAGSEGGYVLWRNPNETDGVRYVHYDAQGNISQVRTCGNVLLSDCQPILYRGNLVWYAAGQNGLAFYTLNEGGISAYDPTNPNHIVLVPQDPEQVRKFVSRMYTVALGRDAEPQGLNDWTGRLLSYEVDGSGIADGFIMSDEFMNKNVSDETYVDILYHTFFDREADAGGRATWLEALSNGNSRRHVLAGFVNSGEFDELCDRFGIIRGNMVINEKAIGPGVRQFVNRCYIKVLGREGEPAGVNDWTGRIARCEETPESTAKLFFFSEEYTNKNTSDEDFVETLYQTFMDRASDPAGKSDWLGRLAAGVSREEVLEGFSRSQEFAGILQSFGL